MADELWSHGGDWPVYRCGMVRWREARCCRAAGGRATTVVEDEGIGCEGFRSRWFLSITLGSRRLDGRCNERDDSTPGRC